MTNARLLKEAFEGGRKISFQGPRRGPNELKIIAVCYNGDISVENQPADVKDCKLERPYDPPLQSGRMLVRITREDGSASYGELKVS